jgi:hypothetical protein
LAAFLFVTLLRADAKPPANKLWTQFGLLLGIIVSPVILGIIGFRLFTPTSLVTRLFGRDELSLRFIKEQPLVYTVSSEARGKLLYEQLE